MLVRTPGRRFWETHFLIRVSTGIALMLLAGSVWFLYSRVKLLESPHNPHFDSKHCFDCHESKGSTMTSVQCFECHDILTRELLPGALAKRKAAYATPCSHPIKLRDPNSGRTVTQLCLSCHSKVNGYVVLTNIVEGIYAEFDMSATHPIGQLPTELVYPRTLPLDKNTGAVNCITCHDPHGADPRMRLLRYYYPGNGHPPDFRPLCNDCHPDGWLPLRLRRDVVLKDKRR